ncbi:hypothetical protein CCYA_CCYA14G3681 [Cyanidiococcus yangmingshanensis]|nr:hypothetical protein CCYA_CCYA14G3681 [Cyanidiococcus yangmingshanensis]
MRTIVSRYTFLTPPVVRRARRWVSHTCPVRRVRCSSVPESGAQPVSVNRRQVCAALLFWVCSGNAAAAAAAAIDTPAPKTSDELACYRDQFVQFWRPKDWTEDRLRRQRAVRNTALRLQRSATVATQRPDQRLVLLAAFQSPLFPESDHLSVVVSGLEPGWEIDNAQTLAAKFAEALRSRPAIAKVQVKNARDTRHRDQRLYADFEVEVFGRAGWHRQNACSVTVHGNRLYTFTLQSRADAWQAARFLTCRDSFLAGVVSSTPTCPAVS